MDSVYQLPPMLNYPSLLPDLRPPFEAPAHPFFLDPLPSPEPYLYGNSLLGADNNFGAKLSNFDAQAALAALSYTQSPQDFLPQYPSVLRQPLMDDILNFQRPLQPPRSTKEIPFPYSQMETTNWRMGASENSQNIAPEKNSIRKTIYVTDVDHQVTEEQLAIFFKTCGDVIDCRVCGDPNSAMRFAFVEFSTEQAAMQALKLNGTVIGSYPLRVLPSKTAIVPVNTQYLPKSTLEREKCSRTVYAANIDKKVDRESVKTFFETICGPVNKIRLLGDWQHATRIAFIEFVNAESAKLALSVSGALLGSLPVRVSPSKTPVRDDLMSENQRPSGRASKNFR